MADLGHRFKLLSYMASRDVKIREPNTLIEAGQKLSREELIIWLWSMLKARLKGKERITREDVERIKAQRKLPILVGEVDLKELKELFPEYFSTQKLKYYKSLLKRMEEKVAFEVNLSHYVDTLKKLGFEYAIEELRLPDPSKVEYFGISVIMAMTLTKDGKILLTYSPYVTPLLLELKTRYTTYDFLQILELSSKYSVILYRLIKEKWGLRRQEFVLTFDELQKIMDTSFKRWTDFNRKVLKPAVEEVSKKTKFTVEYKPLKTGKKVDRVVFFVKEKLFLPTAKGVISPQELYDLLKEVSKEISTPEEVAEALLSLERVNPAVALWFLLHYPEGEARYFAWQTVLSAEENPKIKLPDRYLISLIPQKNPQLSWLLEQRTKDLLRRELEKSFEEYLKLKKNFEELYKEFVGLYNLTSFEKKRNFLQRLGLKTEEELKNHLNELKSSLNAEGLKKLLKTLKEVI